MTRGYIDGGDGLCMMMVCDDDDHHHDDDGFNCDCYIMID